MAKISFLSSKIFLVLLRGYQLLISPVLGNHCRYSPSCSEYCKQAIEIYGTVQGLLLGSKRLLRCHPWHVGGYDPVPTLSKDEQC